MYWLLPGHYILEGLLMTQYENDETQIRAQLGSPFYKYLNCANPTNCSGSAMAWVDSFFGGEFSSAHVPYDILYLIGAIVLTRIVTIYALGNLNYRST